MLRGEGLRLPGDVAEFVPTRLATLTLPHGLEEATAPVVALLGHLNAAIETADTQVTTLAARGASDRR